MTRVYDISATVRPGMPGFPGDPPVELTPVHEIARGAGYNLSVLSLGTHTGTHIDPPRHFLPGGPGADRIDLATLNGACRVVRIPDTRQEIGIGDLRGLLHGVPRVLFRTSNSARWELAGQFFEDYVALTPEAAEYLAPVGVKLIGIDSSSIELDRTGRFPVHHTLLESGCLILEGLRLAEVPEGEYELRCLPLKIEEGDGAPCRAVLIAP